MKYCPYCGNELKDENPKFCSNCGKAISVGSSITTSNSDISGEVTSETKMQTETPDTIETKNKSKKLLVVFSIASIVVIVAVLSVLLFLGDSKEKALSDSEDLLGVSREKILSDETFTSKDEVAGIIIIKRTTDDLFGVAGENILFILPEDERVNIATWQSFENVSLTTAEIESFISGMEEAYGEPASTDDSYLWTEEDFMVMLEIDTEGAYITWGSK